MAVYKGGKMPVKSGCSFTLLLLLLYVFCFTSTACRKSETKPLDTVIPEIVDSGEITLTDDYLKYVFPGSDFKQFNVFLGQQLKEIVLRPVIFKDKSGFVPNSKFR